MQRVGSLIGLRPEHMAEYRRVHAAVWPDVLKQIEASNIINYTIFVREPENLLSAYFEYVGDDLQADMERMAADPVTQDWWKICMPMQKPLETTAEGQWWASMGEVLHHP